MSTIPSPNMNMPVPVPGNEAGPQWALDLNSCLSIIDQHDHTSGYGAQITPGGLNINSDLPFGSNNATGLRSVRLNKQSAVLALGADLDCLYDVGGDLYYNDGSGNHVRITQSGGVAGSPGSISGLTSPASASYVSMSQTFVWQSAASTPASLDSGPLYIRNLSASSNYALLNPPASIPASFSLTLPTLPASTKLMTLSSTGIMAGAYDFDNTTIRVTGNILNVITTPSAAITDTQLASNSVITSKILDLNVTRPKLEAVDQQISSSSGSFSTASTSIVDVTNLTVTRTFTGRPVMLMIQSAPDTGGSQDSYIGQSMSPGVNCVTYISIYRDSGYISSSLLYSQASGEGISRRYPPSIITYLDVPAAGSHTYKIRVVNGIGGNTAYFYNCVLVAYEL